MLASDAGLYGIWGAALAVAVGIALVLAGLLVMLLTTSRAIEGYTARSRIAVEQIAADVNALAVLTDTSQITTNILAVTRAIERCDQEIADALAG